jgi:hypothetical protein
MSQTLFYVSHVGVQDGPFSIAEIVARVVDGKLDKSDYIYDEGAGDWLILMAHPELSSQLMHDPLRKPAPSTLETPKPLSSEEWYILKKEMRYGPFAIQEILKLLQEKSVFDSDFVWRTGMKTWCMLSECADFSAENINKLRESGTPINETYFRRRYARAAYDTSILVHDNKKVYKGQSVELSEGGAGIMLETPTLEVGHKLYLHFKPASELPSFNAVCEVVSRRMVNSSDKNAPVHYGVKFTSIERHYTHKIHDYTQKSRAA